MRIPRLAGVLARLAAVTVTVATFATGVVGCDAGFSAARGGATPVAAARLALVIGPDDGSQSIVSVIRSARRRVLVEMYMLTAPDAVDALLAARQAGCEVGVLLESRPYGAPEANLGAFARLTAGGVAPRWIAWPDGFVHAKVIIVDDAVAVLTMNLTVAGLSANREYAVIDGDPHDVAWAEAVWRADARGGNPPAPRPTRLVTSPIDARARLAAAIDGARVSILIEIEEISDVDLVAGLTRARLRGVAITVVAPRENRSAATTAALAHLIDGGARVRVLAAPTVHAKAMVVDDRQAYVGSVNFTRASMDNNRELGIMFGDPALVARVAATITDDATRGTIPPAGP